MAETVLADVHSFWHVAIRHCDAQTNDDRSGSAQVVDITRAYRQSDDGSRK